MGYLSHHKLLLSTIIIQILALPVILTIVKQSQDTRTRASEPEKIIPLNSISPNPIMTEAPSASATGKVESFSNFRF